MAVAVVFMVADAVACSNDKTGTGPGCGVSSGNGSDPANFSAPQIIAGAIHGTRAVLADCSLVYWGTQDGVVAAAAHDGTSVVTLATEPEQDAVSDFAENDDYIYWGTGASGPTRFNKATKELTVLVPGSDGVVRLAIDENYVYWTTLVSSSVHRVPKEGGSDETLLSGLSGLRGIDASGERIFFAGYGDGTIRSAALDGTDPQVIAYGQEYPSAVKVAGDRVYWTTERDVMSASISGGDLISHAPPHRSDPLWLAIDATYIYYSNTDNGSVERVPIDGGSMEVLVADQGTVQDITVAGRELFYASSSNGIVARVTW